MTIRIAIIGYGKIARDSHVPALRANPAFELVAVVGRSLSEGPGVPAFHSLAELLAAVPVDAVAITTPPAPRHAIALEAIDAGLDLLIEKPPTATLGEIHDMAKRASATGRTLFTAWHSQHNGAVAAARTHLAGRRVSRLLVDWREDVRKWHPGQDWIWEPGGFGVFDTGINALSILTRILPMPLLVAGAELSIPRNRQGPIAAHLHFAGADMEAVMDWRAEGECWTIAIETDDGRRLRLLEGGTVLEIDGARQPAAEMGGEYSALYARFAELVAARQSEVDSEPLRIVADAFLVGSRELVGPFD